jgi:hypothetical protein
LQSSTACVVRAPGSPGARLQDLTPGSCELRTLIAELV